MHNSRIPGDLGMRSDPRPSLAKVIVHVSQMQRAVEFYRDSIGLDIESPREPSTYADEKWVTFNAGQCTLALRAGAAVDAGADAPKLVIAVADIERARARLISHGQAIDGPFSPAPGLWVVNLCDPDGNVLSLESFTAVPSSPGDAEATYCVM